MFSYSEENYFLLLTKNQLHLGLYAAALFLAPIILSHQLLAGIVVNAILFHTALKYDLKKTFALALIPSLGAVAGGMIFGNLTPYLITMLPFIWCGNIVLMIITKKLVVRKKVGYFKSTFAASLLKTTLLFTSAFILYYFALVPIAFITAFGLFQLITAESGAIIVRFISIAKDKF